MSRPRRDTRGCPAQPLAHEYAAHQRRRGHQIRIRRDPAAPHQDTELIDTSLGEWIVVATSAEPAPVRAAMDRCDAALAAPGAPGHTHRSILLPNQPGPGTIETALNRGFSVLAWRHGDLVVRRSPAALAALAGDDRLWNEYVSAVVDIDLPAGCIRITPCPAPNPAVTTPPAGPMHILAVCQPGERPGTDRERLAWRELRSRLHEHGVPTYPAMGGSPDGEYRELSVAASGLTDDQARAWGRALGQVAVFAWHGTQFVLLASATDRVQRRSYRIGPCPPQR